MEAVVPIRAKIVERKLSLKNLVGLKAGDIIPVEMPEHVTLQANGIPVFKTSLGTSKGNVAVKVLETYPRPGQDR